MADKSVLIKAKNDGFPKTKNQWFRFYSEVLNDHKVQSLDPTTFKGWINLLCLANDYEGKLPSIEEIAFKLRLSQHSARELVDALVLHGLVDIEPDGSLTPHNWSGRQFRSDVSTERVRKHRQKKQENECETQGNVSHGTERNVSETSTETETDTEADTETDKKSKTGTRGSRLPDDWTLPDEWRDWVLVNVPSFPEEKIDDVAEQFANYWQALSGAKATKRDWFKTWKNRVLEIKDWKQYQHAPDMKEKGEGYQLLERMGVFNDE